MYEDDPVHIKDELLARVFETTGAPSKAAATDIALREVAPGHSRPLGLSWALAFSRMPLKEGIDQA